MRPIDPGLAFPTASRGEVRSIGSLFEVLEQEQDQAHPAICASAVCRLVTTDQLQIDVVRRQSAHQDVHVLHQERVGIVQLIERDVDLQILFRQSHVLIKLKNQSSSY